MTRSSSYYSRPLMPPPTPSAPGQHLSAPAEDPYPPALHSDISDAAASPLYGIQQGPLPAADLDWWVGCWHLQVW